MTVLLLIWNLRLLARILLSATKPEPQPMTNDPVDKRSPKETAQLARDVMRRMIETPPKPHEKLTRKPKKKSRRR